MGKQEITETERKMKSDMSLESLVSGDRRSTSWRRSIQYFVFGTAVRRVKCLLMCPLGSLGLSRETPIDQFTEKKDVSSFGAREPEPVWTTFK